MKNFKSNWFSALFILMTVFAFSQGKVKGSVLDAKQNETLPGVNISIKGSSVATSTDADGKFSLNTTTTSGQVVISYVGYETKTIGFSVKNGETVDLGTIKLNSDSNELDEVVIKSTVIDIAKDRKTPVAVSTIKASEIQQKLGNQEFPEILANTPSVYTTKTGGGFGDARVNIRGFSQENIAVMINGVPVNDMENSRVFWSNWAGLSDVTTSMQVQRGLGSSKLAISSVGGTINIVTRTADIKEGGLVATSIANDNYLKTLASYSTGKMKNGLSASVLLSQTRGAGYIDGTKFAAANYFIGLGYEFNKKHDIQLTFTGAPQWHNQRNTSVTIKQFIDNGNGIEPNIKYNSDWGYLNNEEYSFTTNYYHKPIASLNWDWKITDKMKLSTVVYGSWGRGAGTSGIGGITGDRYNKLARVNGLVNVDGIQQWNSGAVSPFGTRTTTGGVYQNSSSTGSATDFKSGISKISSFNSHNWYGGIMNLNTKISNKLILDFGLDVRTYRGIHYQNLNDLIGAKNYNANFVPILATSNDINNPVNIVSFEYAPRPNGNPFYNTDYQQKITYNNDGLVRWYGAFTQLEYSTDKLTAFVQGSVSQQGFKRVDYFKYLASNPLSATSYKNILGGNIKGGVNYNINDHHNVFVNSGYYSKQPNFRAVYPNNASIVAENLTNEKITGFEAGYGFRSRIFSANLNVYHTTWKDRYQRSIDGRTSNIGGYVDFTGITEVHKGVELDMNAKISDKLKINGMVSVGDWKYKGNSTSNTFDVSNNPVALGTGQILYLDNVRVGDAAQTTAAIGASYEVIKRVTFDANYRYTDKLFAAIAPAAFQSATNKGALQLPSFGLTDVGMSYKMLVGKNQANSIFIRANVNNLFDRIYIAESRTNIFTDDYVVGTSGPTYASSGSVYEGIATGNQVFFGFGRTWNFGITYNF